MFKNQIIHEQDKTSKYYIDLVFPEHKLGIQIDENGHTELVKFKILFMSLVKN